MSRIELADLPAAPWPGVRIVATLLSAKRSAISCLFGAVLIVGVIAVAGRPAVFADTNAYNANGEMFLRQIGALLHLGAPAGAHSSRFVLSTISEGQEWYGLMLWPAIRLGSLWAPVLIQSALGGWLIWIFWRSLAPGAPPWSAYAVQAATALLSTLPYFAGFAMPDVFGGYMLLALVLLLAAWSELAAWERCSLGALIAYSVTVHGANAPLAWAVVLAGAAFGLTPKHLRRNFLPRLLTVGVAVYVGVVLGLATANLRQAANPSAVGRAPYLAMRLIADGPGRRYLLSACARGERYVLCDFRKQPLSDAQEMLWSLQPGHGVFLASPASMQLAIEKEQVRFALHTVLFDPIGVLETSTRNWLDQARMVWVDEPLADPYVFLSGRRWRDTDLPSMIESIGSCGADRHQCSTRLSSEQSAWFHSAFFLIALALIAFRLRKLRIREAIKEPWVMATALLLLALLANAFICGVISGPFVRYQARLVWVVTLAAATGLLDPRRVTFGAVRA